MPPAGFGGGLEGGRLYRSRSLGAMPRYGLGGGPELRRERERLMMERDRVAREGRALELEREREREARRLAQVEAQRLRVQADTMRVSLHSCLNPHLSLG
jgi:hypothetical protein